MGALLFGFALVFAFALVMQITTDLVNWVSGSHIQFLFPRGLSYAFADMNVLRRVLISLSFFALVFASIFFVLKLRRRNGIFDIYDGSDTDD